MRVTEPPQFEISITEAPTFILDQDPEPQNVELETMSQAIEPAPVKQEWTVHVGSLNR